MKQIPTSKLSPVFSEGKVAIPSLTFTNTSIQLMQALKCSLRFSYPVLETALGISKRSQIFISLWQAVFYFKQQEDLFVHEKFAQQLPIPGSSEEAMFNVKL